MKWKPLCVLFAFVQVLGSAGVESAPLVPHVYRSGLNLCSSGAMQSRAVTYWKKVVYVSIDAPTCHSGGSTSSETLMAIDVSNPAALRYLSKAAPGGCKANGLVASEDKLYVAHWFRMLTIWDISTPGEFGFLGEYVPDDRAAWDLSVSNGRAYLAESRELDSSFHIVDVGDPRNPAPVSVLSERGGPAVRGSYSFYTDGTLFKVLNISDEQQPYDVATVDLHQVVGEIALRDHYAFVKLGWLPDPTTGMVVFDISDPVNPVEAGRWIVDGSLSFRGITLLGDLAFLPTSGNGFLTVDISDPRHPATLAQTDVPYYALELAIAGNDRFVYVATTADSGNGIDCGGGLHAFQVLTEDPDDAGPRLWSGFSTGEASWDLQYECDVLPSSLSPAWALAEGSDAWASVSNGILRINDTGTAPGDKIKWAGGWDATNTRGATLVARAKCPSYSVGSASIGTLGNIYVRDGKYVEEFAILSDRVRAVRANLEYFLDGTSWHTYRITTRGSEFRVYVDEEAHPVMTGQLRVTKDQDPDARRARVMIGSGSSAATQDIWFDYVHCFSNGAVPPPPLLDKWEPTFSINVADTPGKGSLSGVHPDSAGVSWSTDGGATWHSSGAPLWQCSYEGDVLPGAAVPPWSIAEGAEAWASLAGGVLRVSDTSAASGSKIKWSRNWNASPAVGTTVLASARCTSVGGDTGLLGNIYIEDGAHAERFKLLPDRLEAAESGATLLLDGTLWHTYRITAGHAQFRVYLDESAVPAMTGNLVGVATANRVMFGSGASAATQEIFFDDIRYSTAGELPPGLGEAGSAVPVTWVPASSAQPADRGVITASHVPFLKNSQTLNKVRFSLHDLAGNVGLSPVYTVRIWKAVDFDNDGDVDQEDFGHLQACYSGPAVPHAAGCGNVDMDEDGDVDETDFSGRFRQCMNGANEPPGC